MRVLRAYILRCTSRTRINLIQENNFVKQCTSIIAKQNKAIEIYTSISFTDVFDMCTEVDCNGGDCYFRQNDFFCACPEYSAFDKEQMTCRPLMSKSSSVFSVRS